MTVYTVSSDAQTSKVCPDSCIPAGIVLTRTGTYTATADMEANSVIHLIPMPKGAQLLDLLIAWQALGSGVTLDVGITDTDYTGYGIDMFFDGLAAEYAGYARWGAIMGGAAAATAGNVTHGAKFLANTWPYEFTADGCIDVKGLASSGTVIPDTTIITGVAIYKMEGGIADET
jgi:hypothetical protein